MKRIKSWIDTGSTRIALGLVALCAAVLLGIVSLFGL